MTESSLSLEEESQKSCRIKWCPKFHTPCGKQLVPLQTLEGLQKMLKLSLPMLSHTLATHLYVQRVPWKLNKGVSF